MNLQHLFVRNDFLALAGAAAISGIDVLASARTVITSSLNLLNHRAHLPHNDLDTTTVATGTTADGAILTTLSLTF